MSSRTPRPARPSATGTTSSTSPASTARSGSPPHPRPASRTSPSSPASPATSGSVGLRGGDRRLRRPRACGSSCATPPGARSRRARAPAGTLSVADVHLWAPGHGYLYDLEVQLVDDTDVVLDSYHQSVGIRTVEVRGTEFLINGDPFYFKGFGMHEDHSTIGKAHSPAHVVQDFELLDWIGANSFRTSHYPYSEDVLDYADRHGIVIIDETAAVGLNMGLGGGIFGGQGYTTFSPETINDDHPRGPRPGDPRAHRPRQEPPERRPVVDRQRARVRHRGRRGLLPPALRRRPRGRPDPPRRLRQRHARPPRDVPRLPVRRRAHAQPLLRLVRQHRRPRQRRDRLDRRSSTAGRPRASRSSSPSTAPTPSPATTP